MRMKTAIFGVLAVVLIVCSALVLLEIGVRIVSPQRNRGICVNEWDRETGTRLIPGLTGTLSCPEYSIDIAINSRGMRDREFPYEKPPGTRRVLCLGDSFTFGYGVEAGETFAKLLERSLDDSAAGGTRWEVLNAGIGSTGTAHQLALYDTEAHRYSPDVVVVCFCPANDFFDNISSGLYTIEGDTLVRHDAVRTTARGIQRFTRFVPGYRYLSTRSHLLNLVRYRVAAMNYRELNRKVSQAAKPDSVVATHNAMTRRLLDAFRRSCARDGSEFVVMFMPPPRTGDAGRWTAEMIAYCDERRIPVLDLAPPFEAARREGLQTYYRFEGHWNAAGHAVAARALHDFLVHRCVAAE
jgi:lysophospholipase L1-like esterase